MFTDSTNRRYSPPSQGSKEGSPQPNAAPSRPNEGAANEYIAQLTPQRSQAAVGAHYSPSNSPYIMTPGNRVAVRPANPLYTSDTWAVHPDNPINTAVASTRSFWAGNSSQTPSYQPDRQVASSQSFGITPPNAKTGGQFAYVRDTSGRFLSARTSAPGQTRIRYTQTEEYHKSPSQVSPLYKHVQNTQTVPSSQFPLDEGAPGAQHTAYGNGTIGQNVTGTSSSIGPAPAGYVESTEATSSDDQQSSSGDSVAPSGQTLQIASNKAGSKGDVWSEQGHPHGIRRALMDPHAEWEETYPGAAIVLNAVNPDSYQMPHGTKVINIKTDFPHNILRSIRYGKYSVMQKVAERIMRVWEARRDGSEKILFLFSVNGSKKFCGIADLVGVHDPNDSISGWQDTSDSKPSVGTFPVRWTYIKDVGYHQFGHIRQPHNHHPVGNMWNGMNFPLETGRQVIETFVKSSATSSILGHPKNYEENAHLTPGATPDSVSRRGGSSINTADSGVGGSQGAMSESWRRQNEDSSSEQESGPDDDTTPTGDTLPVETAGNAAPQTFESPPGFIPSSQMRPGQLMSIIVNDKGQLVLVGVQEPQKSANASINNNASGSGKLQEPATSNASAVGNQDGVAQSEFPISHSLNGLPGSTMAGLRGQFQSQSLLHPAVSMSPALGQQPGSTPTNHGAKHYAIRPPNAGATQPGGYVAPGTVRQSANETPTRRPAPHRSVHGAQPVNQLAISARKPIQESENVLRAKFHAATAEQYGILAALEDPDMNGTRMRLLSTKMGRVLTEKRELKAKLAAIGVTNLGEAPPTRTEKSDIDMVLRAANFSGNGNYMPPNLAQGGPYLHSVSKYKTGPPQYAAGSATFDKAPGGSDRPKKQSPPETGEATVKRSIGDLLNSPQEGPAAARPPHTNSSFFLGNNAGSATGKASSFHHPVTTGQQHVSSAANALNFPVTSPPRSDGVDSFVSSDQNIQGSGAFHGGGVRLDS